MNPCHKHCLNGGTCQVSQDLHQASCHCPSNVTGPRCEMPRDISAGGTGEPLDNSTIDSLTATIVSVSAVAVVLVVALVVLLVFLFQKRRILSPFKHRRMPEAGGRPRSNNMEFANRMFLQVLACNSPYI